MPTLSPYYDYSAPDYGYPRQYFVCAPGGVSIYLYGIPDGDSEAIGTINDGEAVTALGNDGDFTRVKTADGRRGWCSTRLLSDNNYISRSMPSLPGSHWQYSYDGNYYCIFGHYGSFCAFSESGNYTELPYTVIGRRVTIGETRFIWNGTAFVSQEKFSYNGYTDYIYIRPDYSKTYDKYCPGGELSGTRELMDAYTDYNGYSGYTDQDTYTGYNPEIRYARLADSMYDENAGSYFVNLYFQEVVGVAPSDKLIFEETGESAWIRLANDCVIKDSTVYNPTEKYGTFYDSPEVFLRLYGDDEIYKLEIQDAWLHRLEKIYIA